MTRPMATDEHPEPAPSLAPAYRICVSGAIDARWAEWLGADAVTTDLTRTTLVARLADQAALFGILRRIRDLGLELVLVEQLEADGEQDTQ